MGDAVSHPQGPAYRDQQYDSLGGLQERSRAETIIIWDWDDTLMCTNAIASGRMMGGGFMPELECLMKECLTISMSLGETFIVTNAEDGWVWETARRFTPGCLGLLMQVPIISARNKFQNRFPGDGFAWKHETFSEIFGSRRLTHGMNLIVLGDSDFEIQAARTSTCRMSVDSLRVKTVKFKEAPTCEELCSQLKRMAQELPSIVNDPRDSNGLTREAAWSVRSLVSSSPFGYVEAPPMLITSPLPRFCSMGVPMTRSVGQPVMLGCGTQVWEPQYGGFGSFALAVPVVG